MTAIETLARFCAGFPQGPLPAAVAHAAQRALVDWHAALYPGLDTPACQVLAAVLADELDRGPAQLLGPHPRRATVRAAALLHGTAAHAAELDDSFRGAMTHPGAPVIAAALAVADAVGASGPALLRAIVLGYEVCTRVGMVMGASHYRYWHSTGTMGSLGAAVAAASLWGLDEAQTAQALALTTTMTAGLQQAFRHESMAKPLHAGRAAEAGVLAARLAAGGLRCTLDMLEGEGGLGRAMSDAPDWSAVGATLGSDFHVTRLSFKNHVGCGHTFAAIDGALALQRAHGFSHRDIAALRLGVYQATLDIAPHVEPQDAEQARFSLHYMVATALVHGSVRLAAFEPPRLHDPATRTLMAVITPVLDAQVQAVFPGRRGARVDVLLRDGRELSHLQTDRRGDPELPLSDEELDGKFMELAAPVIGPSAAQARLRHLRGLAGA